MMRVGSVELLLPPIVAGRLASSAFAFAGRLPLPFGLKLLPLLPSNSTRQRIRLLPPHSTAQLNQERTTTRHKARYFNRVLQLPQTMPFVTSKDKLAEQQQNRKDDADLKDRNNSQFDFSNVSWTSVYDTSPMHNANGESCCGANSFITRRLLAVERSIHSKSMLAQASGGTLAPQASESVRHVSSAAAARRLVHSAVPTGPSLPAPPSRHGGSVIAPPQSEAALPHSPGEPRQTAAGTLSSLHGPRSDSALDEADLAEVNAEPEGEFLRWPKMRVDPPQHSPSGAAGGSNDYVTYLQMTGGAAAYAGIARAAVNTLVSSMSASADVLAVANLTIDISKIEEGTTATVKWRGKPVFIRHRTAREIGIAKSDDSLAVAGTLRDPEFDADRVQDDAWLIVVGVCTHLGCVPINNSGEYHGWFCPCHGSHYDTSGRIRKGPAPSNLEVPPYSFIKSGMTLLLGTQA